MFPTYEKYEPDLRVDEKVFSSWEVRYWISIGNPIYYINMKVEGDNVEKTTYVLKTRISFILSQT